MEIFIDNIKMSSRIYYQSNKKYYSQYQRKFYSDNKETLKEHTRIKYHNLTPEEKEKRNDYAKNKYNKDKKMKKEHMVKTDIITCPVNNYKNIKNIKNIIKKYREKKKQELQNSKK